MIIPNDVLINKDSSSLVVKAAVSIFLVDFNGCFENKSPKALLNKSDVVRMGGGSGIDAAVELSGVARGLQGQHSPCSR